MFLHLLPEHTGGAAENMATDFLLLQRYPEPESVRFRHYTWRTPAVTFGYSQKWAEVLPRCETDRDFCRRPTGGGIVDHDADWTYSLIIPRTHSLYREPAPLSYYLIHQAICDALLSQSQEVGLEREEASSRPKGGAKSCFLQAEVHDVIIRSNGEKVAGAALKRNKNGLLFQGSIARGPLPKLDWSHFSEEFVQHLAQCLTANVEPRPWPELNSDEEADLIDQFSSPEWNHRR